MLHEHLALAENVDLVCHACLGCCCHEADGRFFHGFAAEWEGAEVHGDHGVGGAEVEEGLQAFFRAGVDGPVAVWGIGADGQQCDAWVQAAADLAEAGEVGGVAGVVERVACAGAAARTFAVCRASGFGVGDDVAAVVAVGVGEHACAPVFAGCHGDGEIFAGCVRGEGCGVPPLEFGDGTEAELLYEIAYAFGDDGVRRNAGDAAGVAHDFAQGWNVEVIHVRMCKQDGVDGRQVLNAQARAARAAQKDESCGEHRVDQQIAVGDLNEERGVADEGDAEFVRLDEPGWNGRPGHGRAVTFAHDAPKLFQLATHGRVPVVHVHWM